MNITTIERMTKVLTNVEKILQLNSNNFRILLKTLSTHEKDIILSYAFGYIKQIEQKKETSLEEILKILE